MNNLYDLFIQSSSTILGGIIILITFLLTLKVPLYAHDGSEIHKLEEFIEWTFKKFFITVFFLSITILLAFLGKIFEFNLAVESVIIYGCYIFLAIGIISLGWLFIGLKNNRLS